MPIKQQTKDNLQRDTLRKITKSASASHKQKQLAALRIAYSEDNKLLTGCINQLVNQRRIYPRFLPTQASGRTSTIDPAVTNWPRDCIEPMCQQRLRDTIYGVGHLGYIHHSWTDACWSVRDTLHCDPDEVMVTWDHDNIEGRIHDLIVNDQRAIAAHNEGIDLHTLVCCDMFNMEYPVDIRNPHTSDVDAGWRKQYHWQGKDTKPRVLAKNLGHGSKYTDNPFFVYSIKGVEQFGVSYKDLIHLAKRYITIKGDIWQRKLAIMDDIIRRKEARSLYGFRRIFFTSSKETGKEGFSHMVSGTVSDYNYETLSKIKEWLGPHVRLMHNAHDGDKIAIKRSKIGSMYNDHPVYTDKLALLKADVKTIIERDITYEDRSLTMTAQVKVTI